MRLTKAILSAFLLSVVLAFGAHADNSWGTTLYAPDGRIITVQNSTVNDWLAVGWEKAVTIYAPDGKTKNVSPYNAETYYELGWYPVPVTTIYDANGNSAVIYADQLSAYTSVGWYPSEEASKTTIYTPDGKQAKVYIGQVDAYIAVGWYPFPVTTIYDINGNSAVIATDQLSAYLRYGWYASLEAIPVFPNHVYITAKMNLYVGDTERCQYFLPNNATVRTVYFSSSNANVATVSQFGYVTAVGAGSCSITVTTANGLSASCQVVVTKLPSVSAPSTDLTQGPFHFFHDAAIGYCYGSNNRIEVGWVATNQSGKTINYFTTYYSLYNAVGDPIFDKDTGKSTVSYRKVGPVEPNGRLSNCDFVATAKDCKKIVLDKIYLEYADGTSEMVYYGYSGTFNLMDSYQDIK